MSDVKQQLSPAETVERDELHKAARNMLASVEGKRLVYWILQQCAIYRNPFCGEATNATNYTLGSQKPGRQLIALLDEADPNLYPDLLKSIAVIRAADEATAKALAKAQTDDSNQENDDAED